MQGSRLTAFELVHDQIPATLIADSAVAALMKAGRVNAVVVGADRIAANGIYVVNILNCFSSNFKISNKKNVVTKYCAYHFIGDTANKIGTYSVALSAYHHGIQFYVAAPITSIDLSISSGDQIVIEERSEKELLHSDGGRGKQVAASGISVWNPAFDVTPARLITAIFTEKVALFLPSTPNREEIVVISLFISLYLKIRFVIHLFFVFWLIFRVSSESLVKMLSILKVS